MSGDQTFPALPRNRGSICRYVLVEEFPLAAFVGSETKQLSDD